MRFEYLVGLQVTDEEKYAAYRAAMLPLLKSHGGGFRYDFKVAETLISEAEHPINRVFVIYFRDEAAKDAFFAHPAYLEIKRDLFARSVAHTSIMGIVHG